MENPLGATKGTEASAKTESMSDFLLSHRFLTLGAQYMRGEVPDLEHAEKAGYNPTDWNNDNNRYKTDAQKYAEAYKLWGALGSITQEDMYSFALLEPFLSQDATNKSINQGESDALTKGMNFLGYRYKNALGHALVWEYIHFESPSLYIDPQNTELDHQVREQYTKAIDQIEMGSEYEEFMNTAVANVIQIKMNLNRIGPKTNPEPWDKAASLYIKLKEALDSGSVNKVAMSIDSIHSASHNNGNLIERMIDQSRTDRDTLVLIEMDMDDNLGILYSHASAEAKSIFKSLGGIEVLSTDYDAQFIKAFTAFLKRGIEVSGMQPYISEVLFAAGFEMGRGVPDRYLDLLPELQVEIQKSLPQSLVKSGRMRNFVSEEDKITFIKNALRSLSEGFDQGKAIHI